MPTDRDVAARFSQSAWEEAASMADGRSRHTVLWMPPGDFLLAASPGQEDSKQERVDALFAAGTPFRSLLTLTVQNRGDGTAQVSSHEGRHRARALRRWGASKVPVLVTVASGGEHGFRWGDPVRRPDWLIPQDGGDLVPFPLPGIRPEDVLGAPRPEVRPAPMLPRGRSASIPARGRAAPVPAKGKGTVEAMAARTPGRIESADPRDVARIFKASEINVAPYEEAYEVFVDGAGRKVAASSFGWREDDTREASFSVAVLPEARRKGIARRLVQSLLRKHPGVTFRPWVVNPGMAALLADLGFSAESRNGEWSPDAPHMTYSTPTWEQARRQKAAEAERAAYRAPPTPPAPPPPAWTSQFRAPVHLGHLELTEDEHAKALDLRVYYASHREERAQKIQELLAERSPIPGLTGLTRPKTGNLWQIILKVNHKGEDESRGERAERLSIQKPTASDQRPKAGGGAEKMRVSRGGGAAERVRQRLERTAERVQEWVEGGQPASEALDLAVEILLEDVGSTEAAAYLGVPVNTDENEVARRFGRRIATELQALVPALRHGVIEALNARPTEQFSRVPHEPHEVKIGHSTVGYTILDGYVHLYSLRTPSVHRRRGSAREAMRAFLAETDRWGMRVELGASPLDAKTSRPRLVRFYASLGFALTGRTINPAGDPQMVREVPRSATRSSSGGVVEALRDGGSRRRSVSVAADPRIVWGQRLVEFLRTDEARSLLTGPSYMDKVRAHPDPWSHGACWILADALCRVFGRSASCVVLVGEKRRVYHVLAAFAGGYWDDHGFHADVSEAKWVEPLVGEPLALKPLWAPEARASGIPRLLKVIQPLAARLATIPGVPSADSGSVPVASPSGHVERLRAADAVERLDASDILAELPPERRAFYPEYRTFTAPDSDAFRRWFGRSKVVDAAGRPKVVYHGTDDHFEAFDLSRAGQRSVAGGWGGPAAYFTDSARVARSYANKDRSRILPVYLSLQNPLDVDADGRDWRAMFPETIDQARRDGHDGVIVRNFRDPARHWDADILATTYVIFDATQVKSAESTVGTYDPADPRIERLLCGISGNEAPTGGYMVSPPSGQRGVAYAGLTQQQAEDVHRLHPDHRLWRACSPQQQAHAGNVEKCPCGSSADPAKWLKDDHAEIHEYAAEVAKLLRAKKYPAAMTQFAILATEIDVHFRTEEDSVFARLTAARHLDAAGVRRLSMLRQEHGPLREEIERVRRSPTLAGFDALVRRLEEHAAAEEALLTPGAGAQVERLRTKAPAVAKPPVAAKRPVARRPAAKSAADRTKQVWSDLRAILPGIRDGLPGDFPSHISSWQHGVVPGADSLLDRTIKAHPGVLYAAYAPARALLTRLGPAVRLYRGEHPGEERVSRAFLSWTDHRGEAAGFADRSGYVRVADVPVGRILAILPHGQGLEFLITPGPVAGERREALKLRGYVEIGRADWSQGTDENPWRPGDDDRRLAEQVIRSRGGEVVRWKPRRNDDEDYWSGYSPVSGHGILHFRVGAPGWNALKKAGFEPWEWAE